jgi:hypothetical protein
MHNFLILFEEKEGTSPLVRLLDNFEKISIIHQVDNQGWEPFDRHNCGPMPLKNLKKCLELIFSNTVIDFSKLNAIYTQTATRPLEKINSQETSVGFKMRFRAPVDRFPFLTSIMNRWDRSSDLFDEFRLRPFKMMMFDVLKKFNVVVLLVVRQDVFRWGLSKYHGDGTGKPGHLQFKLADGRLSKKEIGKIDVDCEQLDKIIKQCEKSHAKKRLLAKELEVAGIQVYPIRYEDFLADKKDYFADILNHLDLETSKESLEAALNKGAYFQKVHSDDISDFVLNHEEVKKKFAERFVPW